MKVKDLVSCCYDTIIIYRNIDDEMMEFEDLYKGEKKNIPDELLRLDVRNFGAKKRGVIEIEVL